MLNQVQKNFVKDTIEHYFEETKDAIKIRAIILSFLEEFTDEEITEYSERLNNMRDEAHEYYLKKKEEEESH